MSTTTGRQTYWRGRGFASKAFHERDADSRSTSTADRSAFVHEMEKVQVVMFVI